MNETLRKTLQRVGAALVILAGLYVVTLIYSSGQLLIGTFSLFTFALAIYVFLSSKAYTYRYLFPGLFGIALFIVLPLVYTVRIGFTNRSTEHLLTYERVTETNFLQQRYRVKGSTYALTLHSDGDAYRLVFEAQPEEDSEDSQDTDGDFDALDGDDMPGEEGGDDGGDDWGDFETGDDGDAGQPSDAGDDAGDEAGDDWGDFETGESETGDTEGKPEPPAPRFVTERLTLDQSTPDQLAAAPLSESGFQPGEPLSYGDIIRRKETLNRIMVRFPDGTEAVALTTDIEQFVPEKPRYSLQPDGSLTDRQTGQSLTPNFDTGYYETPAGEPVEPGFEVDIGFENYVRIFTNKGLREPFVQVFIWTVIFSLLTVLFTLIVGFLLSELMSWEALRFRGIYQLLLFLPYAVPGFISILVFKGLFNENLGEINLILGNLLGIQPRWFSDPFLAKVMILLVNTWLGYPYIMLLCMGLRKSIPGDLYEASAVEGASAWDNITRITWPLIRKPLMPLLVSSFAFNFNNFVLIYLLTGGRPDIIGTQVPAGETDILVSYTYRLAFQDAGKQYGLAGAIATLIFVLVAILSVVNLRLTKVQADENKD